MPYADPERQKAYTKQYYRDHISDFKRWRKTKYDTYDKQYREKNKERNALVIKEWRRKNPNKVRGYYKKWLSNNLDKARESTREWNRNNPDYYKEYRKNFIWFLGKAVNIGFRQITGYCSRCTNNIFDGSCKLMLMHHYFYVPCMPWACRIELCGYCHNKEHYH